MAKSNPSGKAGKLGIKYKRANIPLPADIFDAYCERAKEKHGGKHLVLMRQALTEWINRPSLEDRIEKLERRLEKKNGNHSS